MRKLLFFVVFPYLPDAIGGSERSFHSLFIELAKRGWQVEVVCARGHNGAGTDMMTIATDHTLGYTCHRAPTGQVLTAVAARIDEFEPDLVMAGPNRTVLPLLTELAGAGVPAFFYSRMLERLDDGYSFPPGMSVIANSEVNARHLERHHRHPIGLVPPTIDPEHYRVDCRRRDFVTFINPIPVKGVGVAIDVARRLPSVRFLFVKARWASLAGEPDLSQAEGLPNVEIWQPQTDMRLVYARTDILLFPSQWEETAGRVIIEAQLSGVPVVASSVGGVPQQVGSGGVLVANKRDAAGYVAAITRLREDQALYSIISARALENASRPRFSLAAQVDAFVCFVETELQQRRIALDDQDS